MRLMQQHCSRVLVLSSSSSSSILDSLLQSLIIFCNRSLRYRSFLLSCLGRVRRLFLMRFELRSKSPFSSFCSSRQQRCYSPLIGTNLSRLGCSSRQQRCHSPLVGTSLSHLGGVYSLILGNEHDKIVWPCQAGRLVGGSPERWSSF